MTSYALLSLATPLARVFFAGPPMRTFSVRVLQGALRRHSPRCSEHPRAFHASASLQHGAPPDPNAPDVHVTFVDTDGSEIPLTGKAGQSLLDLAHEHGVELEGACEGSIACSTCHVILPQSYYDRLSEPSDEENDMLDMAFGLTDTSRLGCQVKLSTELEGMRITIPSATRNMMVDKK